MNLRAKLVAAVAATKKNNDSFEDLMVPPEDVPGQGSSEQMTEEDLSKLPQVPKQDAQPLLYVKASVVRQRLTASAVATRKKSLREKRSEIVAEERSLRAKRSEMKANDKKADTKSIDSKLSLLADKKKQVDKQILDLRNRAQHARYGHMRPERQRELRAQKQKLTDRISELMTRVKEASKDARDSIQEEIERLRTQRDRIAEQL